MSNCPGCGRKGRHVGVFVPKDPIKPPLIVHECENLECPHGIGRWEERANSSLVDILADWGRSYGP